MAVASGPEEVLSARSAADRGKSRHWEVGANPSLSIALAVSREWARLAAMAHVKPKPPEKPEPMEIEGLAGEFYR